MIFIRKESEPEWLREFKRKNPQATYDSVEFKEYKGKLREVLVKEQKGLCGYCCSKINMANSHNEHIEPRHPGTYTSKKSLNYDNIIASCQGYKGSTCGPHKDNDYEEEQFISPLTEDCEKCFSYTPNGEIEGDKYTIELLHLDSYELNQARKATYKWLLNMDVRDIERYYLKEDMEELLPFTNVIKWYANNHK